MSGVINRFTIATGAVIMILGGIFPAIGYALTTIPQAVLGGCTIMMFGSILFAGFGMMARSGFSQRNMVIVSLSLSIGLGFTQAAEMFNIFPEIIKTVFANNCVAVVFLLAVLKHIKEFWHCAKSCEGYATCNTTCIYIAGHVMKDEALTGRVIAAAKEKNPGSAAILVEEGRYLYKMGKGDALAAEIAFGRARSLLLEKCDGRPDGLDEADRMALRAADDYLAAIRKTGRL